MANADYRVQLLTAETVILCDLDLGSVSVTNDASAVVAEVALAYPGRRIFYRDSVGDFAELLHDSGTFTGFAPASMRA